MFRDLTRLVLRSTNGVKRSQRSTPVTPPYSVRTAELQNLENMQLKRPTPLTPRGYCPNFEVELLPRPIRVCGSAPAMAAGITDPICR